MSVCCLPLVVYAGMALVQQNGPIHRYFVSYKLGRQANLNLLSLNAKGNKVPAGHVLCRCGL